MDDRPRYMISIAAELVGMHPQTLRIYENKGLINPKRTRGNTQLYSEHLLVALLDQELPRELVESAPTLRAEAEDKLAQRPTAAGGAQQPQISAALAKVLDRASDEARSMQDDYVSTEHLLLALDVVPRQQLEAKIKAVRGGQRVA